jgi:predicted kinase
MSETDKVLSVADIAAMLKQDGENVVVLTVGVPGSRKSTLATALMAQTPFVRINSDSIRKEVTGSEADHTKEGVVWGKFQHQYEKALRTGKAILIDNMNHTRQSRRPLIKAAQEAGYHVKLVFMRTPLDLCIAGNRARAEKEVDKGITDYRIMRCHMQLERTGQPIDGEWALMLAPGENRESYRVVPALKLPAVAFDIIGDIHGCFDELMELTLTLGYRYRRSTGKLISPPGRRLILVGDLNDRGPDSASCLQFGMDLAEQGGEVVHSNHGRALKRALRGDKMRIDQYLQDVIDQIDARGPEFRQAVLEFLGNRPLAFQAMVDGRELTVVHAAYSEKASEGELSRLAIYGQTTGRRDANGFPERSTAWETMYLGGGTVVHGHTYFSEPSIREVSYGGNIVNVDTGCVFGGKLTALCYPEMQFVSVPARRTYVVQQPIAHTGDVDEKGGTVIPFILPKEPVIWSGRFGVGKGLPTLDQFAQMQADGWISSQAVRTKDGLTYRIFNYTKATTFERLWNDVTLVSRGLIVCEETGECVAASLPKFFNLGERIADGRVSTLKDGPFEVLVKMDGSCGIGYRLDGEIRWSTRGSFHSEQAACAQEMWDARYRQHNALLCGELNHLTPVVEIIHPVTRVVCPYDFEDLVLIALRDRFTGADLPYEELVALGQRLGMRVVERVESDDADAVIRWAEALPGKYEGVIFNQGGDRNKVKGLEYKRLHRILSEATPAELCRRWFDGSLGRLLRLLPEEFREETETMAAELDAGTIALVTEIETALAEGRQVSTRREYAEWVKKQKAPLPKFLYTWRERDEPGYATTVARRALARLINLGQVEDLLVGERHSQASAALSAYGEAMTTYLWDNTRTTELRNKMKSLAPSLPKVARGPFDGVIVSLQPALIVEKMRAFIERSQDLPEFVGVSCDEVMARAPAPDASDHQHSNWVFSHPPLLRTFLERWRVCGVRETAEEGAYKLLANAVHNGDVAEYVTVIERAIRVQQGPNALNGQALKDGLSEVCAELEALWISLPHGSGPQAVADAVAALGERSAWGTALLSESWSSLRAHVRDEYLASEPELSSFSKLEEG